MSRQYLYKSALDLPKVFPNALRYNSELETFSDRQRYPIISLVAPVVGAPILKELSISDDGVVLSATGSIVPMFYIAKSLERLVILMTTSKPDPNPDNDPVAITGVMAVSFLDLAGFYDEDKKKARKKNTTFKLPKNNLSLTNLLRSYTNVLDGGKLRNVGGGREKNPYDDPMEGYWGVKWLDCVLSLMVEQINSMEDPAEKAWHLRSKLCCVYFLVCVYK